MMSSTSSVFSATSPGATTTSCLTRSSRIAAASAMPAPAAATASSTSVERSARLTGTSAAPSPRTIAAKPDSPTVLASASSTRAPSAVLSRRKSRGSERDFSRVALPHSSGGDQARAATTATVDAQTEVHRHVVRLHQPVAEQLGERLDQVGAVGAQPDPVPADVEGDGADPHRIGRCHRTGLRRGRARQAGSPAAAHPSVPSARRGSTSPRLTTSARNVSTSASRPLGVDAEDVGHVLGEVVGAGRAVEQRPQQRPGAVEDVGAAGAVDGDDVALHGRPGHVRTDRAAARPSAAAGLGLHRDRRCRRRHPLDAEGREHVRHLVQRSGDRGGHGLVE